MAYTTGTSGNDKLTAGNTPVFGGKGDDTLTMNSTIYVQYALGGAGNDTYKLGLNNLTVISDIGGNDTIVFPLSYGQLRASTIDSQHLLLSDYYGNGAIIVNGATTNSIESIKLTDRILSSEELMSWFNTHRSDIPNYTWSTFINGSSANQANSDIIALQSYDRELDLQQEGKATLSAAPVPGTSSALIQHDGFNALFYLAHNQDVAASGIDAYTHYETYGKAEGRSPNAYYDEKYYFDHNPDVAAAKAAGAITSGYDHFIVHGLAEGRAASGNYTEMFYLHNNPDVAVAVQQGAFHSGFEHYVLIGSVEGRVADHYIA